MKIDELSKIRDPTVLCCVINNEISENKYFLMILFVIYSKSKCINVYLSNICSEIHRQNLKLRSNLRKKNSSEKNVKIMLWFWIKNFKRVGQDDLC